MRASSTNWIAGALVAALVGLMGCGGPASDQTSEQSAPAPEDRQLGSEPPSEPPTLRIFVYECDPEFRLVAHFVHPDSVRLVLPDRTIDLPRVPAASGAKYADGDNSFWTKANEATLVLGDGSPRICLENRRRSVMEDARRRGMEIWATGNEPGWTLQLGPELIVYTGDYGSTRLSFPTPKPLVEAELGRATYSTQNEGQKLELRVIEEACTDDMSGEPFSLTIELQIGDRRLRGCGHRLR